MLDEARLLLERRVPPALAARCEEIHAAGGLGPPPPGAMPDVLPPALEASPEGILANAGSGRRLDRWRPVSARLLRGLLKLRHNLLLIDLRASALCCAQPAGRDTQQGCRLQGT